MRLLLEMLGLAVVITLLWGCMAVMAYTTRTVVLWAGWCVEEDTAQTLGVIVTGIVVPAVALPVIIRGIDWWVKRTNKD